jgi:phage tail tube protein FII
MKMEQSVLKHQNIKFRCRVITQEKDSTILSFARKGRVKKLDQGSSGLGHMWQFADDVKHFYWHQSVNFNIFWVQ